MSGCGWGRKWGWGIPEVQRGDTTYLRPQGESLWVSGTCRSCLLPEGWALESASQTLLETESSKFQMLATAITCSLQPRGKQKPEGTPSTWLRGGPEGRYRRWSVRAETPSTGVGHVKGSQGCQFPFSLEWMVLSNPEALFKG